MKPTLTKIALAGALLATTALVAPSVAAVLDDTAGNVMAANTAGVDMTTYTGDANNNFASYFAPVATVSGTAATAITPSLGRGKKVAASVTGLANAGNVHLIAYYFDSSDSFIEAVTVASDTTANGNTILANVAALASNSAYKYVRFGVHFVNAGDGVGVANAIVGLQDIQSNGTASSDLNHRLLLTTINKLSTDSASGTAAVLKADTDITRYTLSDYAGPTITAAKSDYTGTGTLNPVHLTFDTGIDETSGADTGIDHVAQIDVLKASDATAVGAAIYADEDDDGTLDGLSTAVRALYLSSDNDTAGADFSASVNQVKVVASTGYLADLAGNPLALPQTVNIDAFAEPDYASTGTAKATITAVGGGLTQAAFFTGINSTDGLTLTAGNTFAVTLRLNETLDDNGDGGTGAIDDGDTTVANDGDLTPATTTGVANDEYIVVTFTAAGDEVLALNADNKLTVDGAILTIALAVDATGGDDVLTSQFGTEITAASDAVPVYVGLAPTTTLATYDANADGVLDGGIIDSQAKFSATIAATHGLAIKDDDATTTSALGTLSLDPNDTTKLRVPGTQTTIVGFLETSETSAANLNTGVTGANLPYLVSATSSEVEYASVYDDETGNILTLADITAAAPTADGASPVVTSITYLPTEGTDPAAGRLKVVVSETMDNTVDPTVFDEAQLMFGNAPLTLLNLNAGVTDVSSDDVSFSTTTLTDDTITIGGTADGDGMVSSGVAGTTLTISTTTASGLEDSAGNMLATSGVTVSTGSTTYAGPTIAQAIGTRSANAVDGNIDTVIVKFSKGVALATGGALEDNMFKVRATVGGTNYVIGLPATSVDISAASTGYVTLNIPAPYIKGTLTQLIVEYNDGTAATANRLVSATGAADIDEEGVVFTSYDDNDTREAVFPENTTKLYTMELKGKLTTDGTTATPKGTIIRADLVDIYEALSVKGLSVNVPCDCSNGAAVAVESTDGVNKGYSDLATEIEQDRKANKAKTRAWLKVTLSALQENVSQVEVYVASQPASSTTTRVYEVEIDTKTGALVGVGSGSKVSGSAVFSATPSLKIFDTIWQVTNDGTFRTAIGTDTAPRDGFILASYKTPDNEFFKGLTSAVPAFTNHVPFASNVIASGTIGGDVGTVNLSTIKETEVDDTENWQLVGFQGHLARVSSDLTRRAKPISAERLLVSIDGNWGAPVTAWAYEGAAADLDEGFLLQNNVMTSALQLGQDEANATSVDSLNNTAPPPPPAANSTAAPVRAQFDGGLAMAIKNPSGEYATNNPSDGDFLINDNIGIGEEAPFIIFYPSSVASPDFNAQASKWSLLTMEADVTSITSWADTNKIGAIIVVGSDNHQKSWFKGATDNTLGTLSQGDRAFIFFEQNNATFKFGRS